MLAEPPSNEICIDRECVLQPMGVHYTKNEWVFFESALDDPRVNKNLEELKNSRGRKCYDCRHYLIYTDGDHSFCNDCWDKNVGPEDG